MELPKIHDIDFEERRLTVPTLKYRRVVRERDLFFDDWFEKILRGCEDGKVRLDFSESGLYDKVKRYEDELGLGEFTPTTCRRTFDTHMRSRVEDDNILKALMGHKISASMSDRYFSALEGKKKRAMRENHYMKQLDLPEAKF